MGTVTWNLSYYVGASIRGICSVYAFVCVSLHMSKEVMEMGCRTQTATQR